MPYLFLGPFFFASLFFVILILVGVVFQLPFWRNHKSKIGRIALIWFIPYGVFILFFTGPANLNEYPRQDQAKYVLPWQAGVSRFVAQGNGSFTSHRDFHFYAWDFVMANGTEILAARRGVVKEIEESFDGIGLKSNFIIIEHEDGEKSAYAHIKNRGSLVKIGDIVEVGQPIALSGMVGQTVFPHVHFYVLNKEGTSSIPIAFRDVESGVPFAGRFYTSQNVRLQSK